VLSTVFITHSRTLLEERTSPDQALTQGFVWGFWVAAGIWAAGLLAAIFLVRREEVAQPGPVEIPASQT